MQPAPPVSRAGRTTAPSRCREGGGAVGGAVDLARPDVAAGLGAGAAKSAVVRAVVGVFELEFGGKFGPADHERGEGIERRTNARAGLLSLVSGSHVSKTGDERRTLELLAGDGRDGPLRWSGRPWNVPTARQGVATGSSGAAGVQTRSKLSTYVLNTPFSARQRRCSTGA